MRISDWRSDVCSSDLIKETANQGLKRAYQITIPAADIAARIDAEVKKITPQVRMPGFRPGKVPANLVRKMHGEQLHAQTINDTIRESVDNLMRQKALRPAMPPRIDLAQGSSSDERRVGKECVRTCRCRW